VLFFAIRNMGSDSEFEEGRILGHVEEQRRLEMYFHDQLGPDLMALAFSIESLREQLEADANPAEPKLREIQDQLSEILTLIRQVTLSDDEAIGVTRTRLEKQKADLSTGLS
jgi:signal transduction histidine kinase